MHAHARRALTAATFVAALTAASSTPAHAGNGLRNFYVTGACKDYNIGWIKLYASNYDAAGAQIYHTSVTKSSSPFVEINGVWLDDIWKDNAAEQYIPAAGHYRHTLKVTGYAYKYNQGRYMECSFRL